MSMYGQLVNEAQMNFSRYYWDYARGNVPYKLAKTDQLTHDEQVAQFVQMVQAADHVVIGGASGLSAAGGGDFYYEDNASYRKYFGKYAEKYGFKGAFAGSFYHYDTPEEKWGYLATFLHTTLHAEVRKPYLDLDAIVKDKDFYVVTTNQDTQFVKLYPESKIAELQGDHRFFQCANCCTDDTWDAVKPVDEMFAAMGDSTAIPTELIPRCPHCGGEAFPWVRGYGNFLQGKKYEEEYAKISDYLMAHQDDNLLFIELGAGRMTPMFIQEPFWMLTAGWKSSHYITINKEYAYMPEQIADRGLAIQGDIGEVLADVRKAMNA